MKYTLKESSSSAYIVTVSYDANDQSAAKKEVLKSYQKDVKVSGFRPGYVPLDLVEKQVNPTHMGFAIKEQIITDQLHTMIKEETEIKWIGNPHSIDWADDKNEITYTLDVYPDVKVLNDDWKKLGMKTIAPEVTEEQKNEVWGNFCKQYADYQDTEEVTEDAVATMQVAYLDEDGNELHAKRDFVGKEDKEKDTTLATLVNGKKKGDIIEMAYDEKKVPADWKYTKDDKKPANLTATVSDVKKQVVPTFDRDMIVKLFGEEAKPQNEEELIEMITESVKVENYNSAMMTEVESLIDSLRKDSLEVVIPQTIVDQEKTQRLKSMQERFGGEENFKKYLEQMPEDQQKEMMSSITDSAKESLEKFMILQKYVELLELDVDWKNQLEAEHKIYEKLTGEKVWVSDKL